MRSPWSHIHPSLFPWMREELDPLTEKLEQLIHVLDDLDVAAVVRAPHRGAGCPPKDRAAIGRAFVAKAVLDLPTTAALIDRLKLDRRLRQICGWEQARQVPSESTFSRAFQEFAEDRASEHLHAAVVRRGLGDSIVGHVARDATEIEARERPKRPPPPDDPDQGSPPAPKRRPGRPRKGEAPPPKPKTRLERQVSQALAAMMAELPTACDKGTKRNSKGHTTSWIGYKLHIDAADGLIPVSALLTSASLHDSQAAIPLARITAERVTYLYDVMDAAYDAKVIAEACRAAGRVPIIDVNTRGDWDRKAERADEADRRRHLNITDPADTRYNERTNVERVIASLKDNFGGRHVRVRGAAKVFCHLGFGLAALAADSLLRHRQEASAPT